MAGDIRPEDAVRAAKRWLAEIYADENIINIALEEVRFREDFWEITLGFDRSEEAATPKKSLKKWDILYAAQSRGKRAYKVLIVGVNDNRVMEMRDRELA